MKTKITLIVCLAALIFAAGCNGHKQNESKQQNEKQAVVIDTTISLRTDSVNPEWNSKVDSMLRLLPYAKKDSNLVWLYLNIGDSYKISDLKTGEFYYFKAKELSEEIGYKRGYMKFAQKYASNILSVENKYDSALLLNKKALEIAIELGDSTNIGKSYFNISDSFWGYGMLDSAIVYLNDAKKYLHDPESDARAKMQVLGIYIDLKRYAEAREAGEEALLYYRKVNDLRHIAVIAYRLSITYRKLGNNDKSLQMLNEAFKIADKLQYNELKMATLNNLANTCEPDDPKIKVYFEEALALSKKINSSANESIQWTNLSDYYLFNKNYLKALACTDSSLAICNQNNFLSEKFKALTIKSRVLFALGRLKEAYAAVSESDDIQKKVLGEETQERIIQAEKKFETDKKQLEIERQQNIIKNQNLQHGLLAGGMAVSILLLALLWYILRLRNRRNRALAEMNATKDKFFSIISHDLKNPALAQRDALQLLIQNAGLWDAGTLTDYAREMLKSAEGQVELLYNLLNWAQIQTGRIVYTPAQFPLSRLLSDTALIRDMAKSKGITLILPESQDMLITGDRNMLSTVIRNLLTNAVKFTPAGGTVTLKASPNPSKGGEDCQFDSPPLEGSGVVYRISVADTGVGMTEEQVRNLFKLNSRHTRRGTADEQGSGLGLIVCRELLEMHGSELHVESEEGKGSRFWFTVMKTVRS